MRERVLLIIGIVVAVLFLMGVIPPLAKVGGWVASSICWVVDKTVEGGENLIESVSNSIPSSSPARTSSVPAEIVPAPAPAPESAPAVRRVSNKRERVGYPLPKGEWRWDYKVGMYQNNCTSQWMIPAPEVLVFGEIPNGSEGWWRPFSRYEQLHLREAERVVREWGVRPDVHIPK